ncbi:MAG: VWA domain-containing protein [Pseudomonadales bacterium]|nr:VWA domain-containing protein [Pseudomonadales bacterium]
MILRLIGLCLMLSLYGCDKNPPLERQVVSHIASIDGLYQTLNPKSITFTTKILFAIDTSGSMGTADPDDLRYQAAQNFISQNIDQKNLHFEVLLWDEAIEASTKNPSGSDGFTQSLDNINATLALGETGGGTNYEATIKKIESDIAADMTNVDDDTSQANSSYIVVFLSDGEPSGGNEDPVQLTAMVSAMKERILAMGARKFQLHSYYLSANEDPNMPNLEASSLLRNMATAGGGSFTRFNDAVDIDFSNSLGTEIPIPFRIKNFVVFNYNVKMLNDSLYVDSDGDGLVDEEELKAGTDPLIQDTDGDGLSDYFEILLSSPGNNFDPTIHDSGCSEADKQDSDGDLLSDCEEIFKQTDINNVDTDNDGYTDYLEFLAGTNPLWPDNITDSDSDQIIDLVELKLHTNVHSKDETATHRYAYDYYTEHLGEVLLDQGLDSEAIVQQYAYKISNINLQQTLADNDINRIGIWLTQIPEDRPEDPATFHMGFIDVPSNCANVKTHNACQITLDWSVLKQISP